jgi:transposase
MSQQPSSSSKPAVIVGIDWADRQHDVCLIDDGHHKLQTLQHDPEAIAHWVDQLLKKFPGRQIFIAIEQSRGALVHALQDARGIVIYAINPKQLARYREAVYPTGKKTDPGDAELLAMFLLIHREKLRPWRPNDAETRKLGYLSELRRKLVEERKALGLRLEGTLKLYFPLVLTLFGKTTISDFLLELLKRWPSLTELKRPHPKTLREFFCEHGVKHEERQTQWIDAIRAATPLTRDVTLIETHALYVQALGRQITELNRAIAEFEDQLRRTVAKHPDEPLFRVIPGAGDNLVPRLIAAFGSDRDRYQSAEDLLCYSGIAPITKRSGQSCCVLQRLACPKFLKQTFHEFADQARRWSAWSRAFYDLKRSQGMKHHAAVRALAFKWIRILFQLWKTNATYSEANYIEHLRLKQSPVIAFLQKT